MLVREYLSSLFIREIFLSHKKFVNKRFLNGSTHQKALSRLFSLHCWVSAGWRTSLTLTAHPEIRDEPLKLTINQQFIRLVSDI